MVRNNIYCVLLAGGSGRRMWPLSSLKKGKSFISLKGRESPILNAIRLSHLVSGKENLIAVTTKEQKRHLKGLKRFYPRNIITEPFGRNTASAIGLGAIHVLARDPDAVMLVMPTDQHIEGMAEFVKSVKRAANFIKRHKNALISLGVKPRNPSVGLGYINIGSSVMGLYKVRRFVEKPPLRKAVSFFKSGRWLWNTGIFVWRADSILEAFRKYAPSLYRSLSRIGNHIGKRSYERECSRIYSGIKNISVDYLLMEKAGSYCINLDADFYDLGTWQRLEDLYPKDRFGNVFIGRARAFESSGSIVYNSDDHDVRLVGVKDIIVARTKNGTLVCAKHSSDKVKRLFG